MGCVRTRDFTVGMLKTYCPIMYTALKGQYEVTLKSEEKLINYITELTTTGMDAAFAERRKAAKSMNKQFQTTNTNMNNFANTAIAIEFEESARNCKAIKRQVDSLNKKLKRDEQFRDKSKDTIVKINTRIECWKVQMEGQIDDLKRAMEIKMAIEAAKAVANIFVGLLGIFAGIPPKPEKIADDLEKLAELIEKMVEFGLLLADLAGMFKDIQELLEKIKCGDFDNLIPDLHVDIHKPDDFMGTLNKVSELKSKLPEFDKLKASGDAFCAEITAQGVSASDLQVTMNILADEGYRLVEEVNVYILLVVP